MTRRGLLVCGAIAGATAACLAFLPMRMAALPALGIWAGAGVFAIVGTCALSAALERRDRRAVYSAVWKDARRALR